MFSCLHANTLLSFLFLVYLSITKQILHAFCFKTDGVGSYEKNVHFQTEFSLLLFVLFLNTALGNV